MNDLSFVCTSCTHGVQENIAIRLFVLQTRKILGVTDYTR